MDVVSLYTNTPHGEQYMETIHLGVSKNLVYKKLIRRGDSERELFYDEIFNHFYVVRPEGTEFGEITQLECGPMST